MTPLVARSRRVPPPRQLATAVVPAGPPCVEHTYALLRREGYIEGRRDDVDVAELNWLRGAQPGFELDLHGMLAEPARSRLHRVIMGQHQRGEHVLLVVVGKGLHSPHGHAVLRENVLLWLVDARIAPFVRAFVSARPNHGGHGSLYVCIRP
ncbi:MAG TPA: hypothetical protein ENK23_08380 [Sorangium sp.]|nr:hypothetical protein [Sorangium sp.]